MLRLAEYEVATVHLTPAEAAELAGMTVGARGAGGRPRVIERLVPTAGPNVYDLQPGPFVGRFRLLSGRTVEVSGRFPFHDLATLLGLGRRPALLTEAPTDGDGAHGLVDLIALAFVREAERLTGQGLAKEYRRRTFTRPPYAGAPSVPLHLRAHAGRPDRLATTANRLTVDVPLNQVIATAYRRLAGVASPNARVRALAPAFGGVTVLPGRPPVLPAVPARYREIEKLSRLVLSGRSVLPAGSGVSGASVLFDMTRVWEDYVGDWLRRGSPGRVVVAQQPIPLTDTGPRRTGYADYVVHQGGRPIAVYDAKYRPWHPSPSTDEIYQLFTYAQRLGVSRAVLVHPGREHVSTTTTVGPVTFESVALPIVEAVIFPLHSS
ncbi:McrC family protein [Actinoplanes sp. G11-F43]|uniref:McrC family protein n=1 Tax=Actinoplanes sp. G11-F43 TaxID=3424130 RepID=UPI003D32E88A